MSLQEILEENKKDFISSVEYLEYSYNKILENNINPNSVDPEDLETLEALVSRFSRSTDIFIAKYLRSFRLKDDPGFNGGLIDTIHFAEKKKIISSAQVWIEIREMRNKISHEYTSDNLANLFKQVLELCPTVIEIKKSL